MTTLRNLVCAFSNWILEPPPGGGARPEPDSTMLLAIQAHPGVSIRDIATMFGLSHSGAVRVIDRLEAANDVVREVGADRRNVALHLSEQGRARARQLLRAQMSLIDQRLASLSQRDASRLAGILEQLLDGAAQDRLQAWRLCRNCDHGRCRGDRCAVGRSVQ